jgi:hypothetical protein
VYEYFGEDLDEPPVGFASQVKVIKYDLNGHKLWATNTEGGSDEACQVVGAALDSYNNCYVEANWLGTSPYVGLLVSNSGAVSLICDDPNGNSSSVAHGVVLDNANDVFVTGQAQDDFDNNSTYGT